MPRRLRKDGPGTWHHVWNRGIAKRTLFETRRDVRFFLACLARQVRAGRIEVHAYSILTTHFHLLVRSPSGGLSAAMQRAQDAYARWFNLGRRRDGPLFRGRFGNRIVDTEAYWWSVLRYIDRNPVEANLCSSPMEYPHASAMHYGRRRGPGWLRRDIVERAVAGEGRCPGGPGAYSAFAEEPLTEGQRWVAERRRELSSGGRQHDPLDELLRAAPEGVRRWMEGKAALADGTRPGRVLTAPGTLSRLLARRRAMDPDRVVRAGGKVAAFWGILEAGGRREFCGQRLREIARDAGKSVASVQIRLRMHAMALQEDPAYLAEAAAVLADALATDHPVARSGVARLSVLGKEGGGPFEPVHRQVSAAG